MEIVVATKTGFKVVESKSNTIIKHVGTKKEVEEHAKKGLGVNAKGKAKTYEEIRAEVIAELKTKEENKAKELNTKEGK